MKSHCWKTSIYDSSISAPLLQLWCYLSDGPNTEHNCSENNTQVLVWNSFSVEITQQCPSSQQLQWGRLLMWGKASSFDFFLEVFLVRNCLPVRDFWLSLHFSCPLMLLKYKNQCFGSNHNIFACSAVFSAPGIGWCVRPSTHSWLGVMWLCVLIGWLSNHCHKYEGHPAGVAGTRSGNTTGVLFHAEESLCFKLVENIIVGAPYCPLQVSAQSSILEN